MENPVKLSEIVILAKETGNLGWFKISDASKVVANAKGSYEIATTMYMQNFVQKVVGDEIVVFGKKQLNVTKLQKDLSRHIGLEVNFYVGGKTFTGILEA